MKKTSFFVVLSLAAIASPSLLANANPNSDQAGGSGSGDNHPRIISAVNDLRRLTIEGNVRPEATASHDLGEVEDSLRLEHMQLLLKASDAREKALEAYTASLNEKSSPNFHHWLSAEEFGVRFGVGEEDIATVRGWLESHGLTVNVVYPNRMLIDFSGSAGEVREAFGTEIHHYDVDGVRHIANQRNPQIPAALAPVVAGVVSLHNFYPHPLRKPRTDYTFTLDGSTYQAVTPADLETIYNLTPLYTAGYTGKGQTIVVIEDTNVYSTADWTKFRSVFGLSKYTAGTFKQVHPAPETGTNNCGNPGVVAGNDGEAILDAEYASAAAPGAAIQLASCSDTETTFGGLIALQNLLNASSTPPALVSISYGECEAENGATANAAYNKTYEQAVSEGVSVFVSSGDEGAASCDADLAKATHGIGVSGFASTPYNVSVGGTDFGDSYAGTNSTYWNATNTAAYGSAKSYIPEIPWNDSCASTLLTLSSGYKVPYGTAGFCNSSTGEDYYLTTGSGSGGPSGCATGAATTAGVVSGTCAGYAKPSWQSLVGVPADAKRDTPDVSLFAANGVWGHFYLYCFSSTSDGGASCAGAPDTWSGAGGTSFASPIMAGIQALVNQKWGRQGNPNPTYYKIAKAEYGTAGSTTCNSTKGSAVAKSCVFYDVTQGDMDVNCTGTHSCYRPSGTNGVLSTSTTAYSPAYKTGTGWDFATGIGTVNAYNLVYSTSW